LDNYRLELGLTGVFGILSDLDVEPQVIYEQLELFGYSHIPCFHAVCVDPRTELGRMTVSNYLHGIKRAEAPVFQFSKSIIK
jgi:hypothetical protein